MITPKEVLFSGSNYKPHFAYWLRQAGLFREDFIFRTGATASQPEKAAGFTTTTVALPGALARTLLKRVNHEPAGAMVTVLCAWGILVSKCTATRQVIVDTPLMGAVPASYSERVPVCWQLPSNATVKEALNTVKTVLKESYTYQNFPLTVLPDSFPLTNVRLEHEQLHPCRQHQSDYDVVIGVDQQGDALTLTFSFREGVAGADLQQQLCRSLVHILGQLEDLGRTIAEVGLLADGEVAALRSRFNATGTDFESFDSFVNLFEECAARYPEAVALLYEGTSHTYRGINEKANQLAHYLTESCGVQAGRDVVGVLTGRSEKQIIALLGILKAGAAFLPVDSAYPQERKAYLLENAGVRVLVTDSQQMLNIDFFGGELFVLDIQLPLLTEPVTNPGIPVTGDDTAYVIYTSGSTGWPKGVQISHSNFLNYTQWANAYYFDNRRGNFFGYFSSLSFDLTITSIFSTLTRGDMLVVLPEEDLGSTMTRLFSPQSLISSIKLTPSHVTLLESLRLSESNVDTVIVGGEALHNGHVAILRSLNPRMRIFNEYGPTETTVGCSVCQVTDAGDHITIGRPIANTEILILADDLSVLPAGITGEIVVGGRGVGKGYLNNQALTREKFIALPGLPATTGQPDRYYRTGDLGYWLPDGELICCGRKDDQVKLRGHRIEPGEITAVLKAQARVKDAVTFVSDEADARNRQLISVVIPDGRNVLKAKDLSPFRQDLPRKDYHTCELPNGLTVFVQNRSETHLIYHEIFKDRTYLKHGITIGEGDVIYDVGANIGLFSLFAALEAENVRVYAFEPLEPTFKTLSDNAALYEVDIRPFNYGLSNENQNVPFTFFEHNTVLSGRYTDLEQDKAAVRQYVNNQIEMEGIDLTPGQIEQVLADRIQTRTVECQVRRLSDVIRENGTTRINLLKIDVEKSEWDVLEGLEDEHWAIVDQIVIEVHAVHDALTKVEQLLASKGFRVVTDQDEVLKGTLIYNVYGVRDGIRTAGQSVAATSKWSNAEMVQHLKTALAAALPAHMVPSCIMLLHQMPLTPNGKLDVRKIKEIAHRQLRKEDSYVAPGGEVEKTLAAIWQQVLRLDKVGVTDNFFVSGGDSLKGIQVVSAMQRDLQTKITLNELFTTPTIRQLAARLREASPDGIMGGIPAAPAQPYYEVSHAQKRIWLAQQADGDGTSYNISRVYRLEGALQPAALERAFQSLLDRHEILRTSFGLQEGRLVQQVHPAPQVAFVLHVVDLAAGADDQVADLIRRHEAQAFDLTRPPLVRATLVTLPRQQFILLLAIHHIAADGWSMQLFDHELCEGYNAFVRGNAVEKAPLTRQYKDYACWQSALLRSGESERMRAYWHNLFAEPVREISLPLDFPRGKWADRQAGAVRFELDDSCNDQLNRFARQQQATPFMVLFAALNGLLARYSGQNDLVIGVPVAGRDHADLEAQLGCFLNMLPLRNRFRPEDSFRELVAVVRNNALQAFEFQSYPVDVLISELNLPLSRGRNVLFDVAFQLINLDSAAPGEAPALHGVTLQELGNENGNNKFDLNFDFQEYDRKILASISYHKGLFRETTIQIMAERFKTFAEAALKNPDTPIGQLPFHAAFETACPSLDLSNEFYF